MIITISVAIFTSIICIINIIIITLIVVVLLSFSGLYLLFFYIKIEYSLHFIYN